MWRGEWAIFHDIITISVLSCMGFWRRFCFVVLQESIERLFFFPLFIFLFLQMFFVQVYSSFLFVVLPPLFLI